MQRLILAVASFVAVAGFMAVAGTQAADKAVPKGKIVFEAWDAAYVEGAKLGHYHTVVREFERDGKKVLATTITLQMTLRRYNSVVNQKTTVGFEETPEGKVLAMSLDHGLDKGRYVQTGKVEDGKLKVRTNNKAATTVPWVDDVLGPYFSEGMLKQKKAKTGDTQDFKHFELALLQAVGQHIKVLGEEEVDTLVPDKLGKKVERGRQKLLRVEMIPGKVDINGTPTPLPKVIKWLNKNYDIVRWQTEMPGLGDAIMYRTTKAIAMEEGAAPALLPDLGLNTLIPLNRKVKSPKDARTVVYRITLQDDEDPTTAFAKDARQSVAKAEGASFELTVKAIRAPTPKVNPLKGDLAFLKASYFLDAKDERIQEVTKLAVGTETDPWKKARLIEKWVHDNMKGSSNISFATASQVARDLRGDCRQHAMLGAAMCRATGIPARTAIGLVYFDDTERGPVLGFHMWTEVWIEGQWLGLDATLGQGGVGATHLKISSPSWNDVQTLAPLLPISRVLKKMKVEIVRVTVPKKAG